jgi:acyl-CoA synthetase (AMP-forming)/AMP-acid ligase II
MDAPKAVQHNLAATLWRAAARHADRVAIIDAERAVTYRALRDRAASIGAELIARGVEPGDRVAVLVERGAEAAAAYFGAMAAGAIVTVANERLRPRQIEYVLAHSGARVLVMSRTMRSHHPRDVETNADVVYLETIENKAALAPIARASEDHAQIIFTSGSTGMPKGVIFSHGAIATAIETIVGYLGLTGADRLMSLMPFSSVYGLNQMLCAVHCGATLVISLAAVPHQIVLEAIEHDATVLAAVPPLWLQLLSTPAFRNGGLEALRVLQNAGGHLPVDAVRQLRTILPNARLFLQYGMTETFRSTFLDPDEVDAHPDSMGRAIPGGEVIVIGDDGDRCRAGDIGELVFTGPTIADGYWDAPQQTAATFRAHPFDGDGRRVVYSGDLVRFDEDGRLFYVSRRDRLIKSLGFRIGPDEIVDVLYASRQIREAAITTEPDPVRGERIIAYVVLTADGALGDLQRFARTELPRHMQPSRIEARRVLHKLPSGKYDLGAIRSDVDEIGAPGGDRRSLTDLHFAR